MPALWKKKGEETPLLYRLTASSRPFRPLFSALLSSSGHQKAVSYIRFLSSTELVSASTDSSLNLWDTRNPPTDYRRFCGHVNEKNFVGLATSGNFIACGSETNEVRNAERGTGRLPAQGGVCLCLADCLPGKGHLPASFG